MAEDIAVWTLNVTDPTVETGQQQNWHEAYRCNDTNQSGLPLLERPWFTWWWTGLPNLSLPYCYKSYEPVIIKPQPTPRDTPCFGC